MANTLAAKLIKASLAVGALKTDKKNTQQNYEYISADKILERAGDALAEAGVVVIPAITAELMERFDASGKGRYDAMVRFLMRITDGESEIDMEWVGRGSDYAVPDKALYKAITSGHKYFLMKLLNIGVGNEDGEHENYEPAKTAPKAPASVSTSQHTAPAPNAAQTPEISPQEGNGVTADTLVLLHNLGGQVYGAEWDKKRLELVLHVTKGATTESKELTENEARKLVAGMQAKLAHAEQPDSRKRAA